MNNEDLVNHLKIHGFLTDELLEDSFRSIDRADFVKEDHKDLAYEDVALPIGFGQTISQPATVATMLGLLEIKEGQKVLDVGYGSGYTSALIASAMGLGEVIAIESNPEIAEWGEKNINKYNLINDGLVKVITGDGSAGVPAEAPFDRILVSASADKIPQELQDQLKIEGILVMPAANALVKLVRKSETYFESSEFPGFVFVPLVEDKSLEK